MIKKNNNITFLVQIYIYSVFKKLTIISFDIAKFQLYESVSLIAVR